MELPQEKIIIGRQEYVSFPEFGVSGVVAKIDTGAYNGCVHANVIGEVTRDGVEFLQFTLLDATHAELKDKVFETSRFIRKKVRHANGIVTSRYVITTNLVLGNKNVSVQIGLSHRGSMRNPVLIGRVILKNNFIVDVAETFLLSK